jgi:hypothetical protein
MYDHFPKPRTNITELTAAAVFDYLKMSIKFQNDQAMILEYIYPGECHFILALRAFLPGPPHKKASHF